MMRSARMMPTFRELGLGRRDPIRLVRVMAGRCQPLRTRPVSGGNLPLEGGVAQSVRALAAGFEGAPAYRRPPRVGRRGPRADSLR
jgi:hypothetical protein